MLYSLSHNFPLLSWLEPLFLYLCLLPKSPGYMLCTHSDNHPLGFSSYLSMNEDITIPLLVSRIPFLLKLVGLLSAWGSHNSALCSVLLNSC